ncbi:MAG: hypothetical protein ACYTGC_14550 [Planctomycetota bacterium]|jgi:hypothetical protein
MSIAQRLLLIGSCLLAAALLHTVLCEWTLSGPPGAANHIVVVLKQVPTSRGGTAHVPRGLVTATGVSKAEALTFGVVLPLLLLTYCIYLGLGWSRAARWERGECPGCGYDLRGHDVKTCPECGCTRTREH